MSVNNVNTQKYQQLFSQVTKQAKAKNVNVSIFDTNKDEKLSEDELQKALTQLNSDQPIPQEQQSNKKGFWASVGSFFDNSFGDEQQTAYAQTEETSSKPQATNTTTKKPDNNTTSPTTDENSDIEADSSNINLDDYVYKGKTKDGVRLYEKDGLNGVKEEIYINEKGQVIKNVDYMGTEEYEYNNSGKRIKTTFTGTDGVSSTTEHIYNQKGQKVQDVLKDEKGNLKSIIDYDSNGNKIKDTEYDKNGNISNVLEYKGKDYRPIKLTQYDDNGNIVFSEEYQYKNEEKTSIKTNKNGKFKIEYDKDYNIKKLTVLTDDGKEGKTYEGKDAITVASNIDNDNFNDLLGNGELGTNTVQQIGNCWLHADINAVLQTEKGKEYLNKLISKDPKSGDITVFLPGAKAKGLPQPKGDGIYTYSEKDLLKRIKDTTEGDGDYTALICAVEDYIRENSEDTNANTESSINPNYSREEIQKVIFGAGFTTTEDINYDDLKDKINSKKYAISCGLALNKEVIGERNGKPYKLLDQHAYTIVAMDDKTVTLMESNEPNNPIKVSKDEFMKMSRINISDTSNLANIENAKKDKGIICCDTKTTQNGSTTTIYTKSGDRIIEYKDKDGQIKKRLRIRAGGITCVDFSNNTREHRYKGYDGRIISDTYDKEGVLIRKHEKNKNSGQTNTYEYNNKGDLVKETIVYSNVKVTIEFDDKGKECKRLYTYHDGSQSNYTYKYKPNGNKIEIRETQYDIIIKEYDTDGKEISSKVEIKS